MKGALFEGDFNQHFVRSVCVHLLLQLNLFMSLVVSRVMRYNNCEKSAPVILKGALFSFAEIQCFYKRIHRFSLCFHKGMYVPIHSDNRTFVSHYFGERFDIHSAFKGASGKGMPEHVKILVFNTCFFKNPRISRLIRTVAYSSTATS